MPNTSFLVFVAISAVVVALPTTIFAHFGRHGGPPGPGGGPIFGGPPNFLRDVSGEGRRQFFQIVTNENSTKAEIQSALTQWAEQNQVLDTYQNFTTTLDRHAQEMRANVSNWLAGDALQLFNELWTIRQNLQITRTAECEQIRQVMEGIQSGLLRHLVPLPPPVIPGPPPRACFVGGPPFGGGRRGGPGGGRGGFGRRFGQGERRGGGEGGRGPPPAFGGERPEEEK